MASSQISDAMSLSCRYFGRPCSRFRRPQGMVFGSFGKTAGFPLPYFIHRHRGLALMRADMQQVRQAFVAGAPGA